VTEGKLGVNQQRALFTSTALFRENLGRARQGALFSSILSSTLWRTAETHWENGDSGFLVIIMKYFSS
jgi:hypothetical protein